MASIVSDTDAREFLGLAADDPVLPLIRRGVERAVTQWTGWELARASYTRYFPKIERGGEGTDFPGEFGVVPNTGGRTDEIYLDHKYVLASGFAVYEFAGAYAGQSDSTDWEALTLGDEFALDLFDDNVCRSGGVKRLGAEWPKARGSVKATYTAGFTATELSGVMDGSADYTDASDIRLAVQIALTKAWNEVMQHRKNQRGVAGPFTAESIEGYSYSKDAAAAALLTGMAAKLPLESLELLQPYRKYGLVV